MRTPEVCLLAVTSACSLALVYEKMTTRVHCVWDDVSPVVAQSSNGTKSPGAAHREWIIARLATERPDYRLSDVIGMIRSDDNYSLTLKAQMSMAGITKNSKIVVGGVVFPHPFINLAQLRQTVKQGRFPGSLAEAWLAAPRSYGEGVDALRRVMDDAVRATCAVHIRLGDVFEHPELKAGQTLEQVERYGGATYSNVRYVQPLVYYEAKVARLRQRGMRHVVLVGGAHTKLSHPGRSAQYLTAVEALFRAGGLHTRLRLGEDPDDDMMYLARAKCFVPSRGGFSALAANLVRANGGEVI